MSPPASEETISTGITGDQGIEARVDRAFFAEGIAYKRVDLGVRFSIGFGELRWGNLELSDSGRAQDGAEFWEDYLRKLPSILLDGTKG